MFHPRKRYTVPLPIRAGWLKDSQGMGRELLLGDRTLVMGVLNVTPDSFADGGVHFDTARAIEDGFRMLEEGADIIDVGGESTRPGAGPVSVEEERRRVLPVIERLADSPDVIVSVDTYKAAVAREAVALGAAIVNDVIALQYDPEMAGAIAGSGAAVVLMHNRGRSRDMYREADYRDVAGEIVSELDSAVSRAMAAGIPRQAILLDPGLGFAKKAEHSFDALAFLDRLASLDRPIVSGPSRKSFLKAALGDVGPGDREWGTAAAVAVSIVLGAHVVRVHGVKEMADVTRVVDRLRESAERSSS